MSISDLKKKVKKIPLARYALELKGRISRKNNVNRNIKQYRESYLKYSTSLANSEVALSQRRVIIIYSHILEKGLSHTDFRPGFGKQVVIDLQDNLKKYIKTNGEDEFAIKNAISLLSQYHLLNKIHGFDDSDYFDIANYQEDKASDLTPYEITADVVDSLKTFEAIAYARHSVRWYEEDALDVSKEQLLDVIKLANTAPSACNRQATHIFAVSDKETLQKIEELHGGCKGFGKHVSSFLFVTSDLSLYSSNESKIPIYDSGIYTMNLLYALQAHGLYSCVLNGSFPGNASKLAHEIAGIPSRYEICGLIAVYKLKADAKVLIAASPRRQPEDVISFVKWQQELPVNDQTES